MQAVIKLENSFNQALAKLDAAADNNDMVAENAKLSMHIRDLEAVRVNKDKKIKGLREKLNGITEREHDALKQVDALKEAQATSQNEITQLQAAVKEASAAKADALMKIDTLETQVKAASARPANVSDNSGLNAEITQLEEKSKLDDATLKNYLTRIRTLRGALREVRIGLKGNVLNAKDVNTAMQIELEALHAQRETDLAEVNDILDKLTPLVEGK
ncbi:MAG: hypothetical protein JKX71_01925 [Amylibacter sp.]|nr:hypothetical protein [Amylibacter sp.]